MNSHRFNNSLNESLETKKQGCFPFNNNNGDFDLLIMEKNFALSSLDYLEGEVERLEEEEQIESRKIRKINSTCFLVSCLSENESEIFDINESTNDFQTNMLFH